MQFLILFPFPSSASVPCCLINTRELCFPSLPFPLPRHVGCQPVPPGLWGHRGPPGAQGGWDEVPGPGSGQHFPFQALSTHNSRNHCLGMKCFKPGHGTGVRWWDCSELNLCRQVSRAVGSESMGGWWRGQSCAPQPSHVPLEPSREGADPQHPSCRQAVRSGPWLDSHLSTGVAQGDPISPQGGVGDHQG